MGGSNMGGSGSSTGGSNRRSRPSCATSRGWSAVPTTTSGPSAELTVEEVADGALLLPKQTAGGGPRRRIEPASELAPEPVTDDLP